MLVAKCLFMIGYGLFTPTDYKPTIDLQPVKFKHSSFSVSCLLNLSTFLKYSSSFLANAGMNSVPVLIWKNTKKSEYNSTNYYLHHIFTKIQQI